jgi:leader peptidase (prepilin peptidase)/N-methyltransferase
LTGWTDWLWPVLVAPFVGSFLGCVAARVPRGRSIVWARSACDLCDHPLNARDLVPIASWLASRGRCRFCGGRITLRWLLIELGALAIAFWAASVAQGAALWASCVLGWMLLALAVIDLDESILPDALTLPLIVLGLAATAYLAPAQLTNCVIGAAAGFIFFAAIRWLYRMLRRRDGLGLGDAKLLAAAGAWDSWTGLPSVVLVAAVATLAFVLFAALRGERIAGDRRIAFGPALCLGTWIVWLYGPLS